MKKKVCFVLSLFLLCSCSYMGLQQDKGMKGLLYAKNEIASLAEEYEIAYQNASLIAQLNWKDKIDPMFFEAEQTLNEWEFLLSIDHDTTSIKEKYIVIRNAILKSLVEIKEG